MKSGEKIEQVETIVVPGSAFNDDYKCNMEITRIIIIGKMSSKLMREKN